MSLRLSPNSARRLFKGRANKYGSRPTGGFDSALEARFYERWLKPRCDSMGHTIETQKRYPLIVNGHHICDYVADFYVPEENTIYETKGMFLGEAKLKLRLTQALYDVRIVVARSLSKFEQVPRYRARKAKVALVP